MFSHWRFAHEIIKSLSRLIIFSSMRFHLFVWEMGQTGLNFKIVALFRASPPAESKSSGTVQCFGAIPAALSHASYLAMRWSDVKSPTDVTPIAFVLIGNEWVLELVCRLSRTRISSIAQGVGEEIENTCATTDEEKKPLTFFMCRRVWTERVVNKSSNWHVAGCGRNSADGGESPACFKLPSRRIWSLLVIISGCECVGICNNTAATFIGTEIASQLKKFNDAKTVRRRRMFSCFNLHGRHIFSQGIKKYALRILKFKT